MTDTTEAPRASSTLAIHAGQDDWTDAQRAQLRARKGLGNAPDADLRLLFHYAVRTGLDAFTGQVYLMHRRVRAKVRVTNAASGNERIEVRDIDTYTVQVGIDGWRVVGNRAARRDSARVGHADTLWRGKGSDWQDYWDIDDGTPVACKYTITVDGVSISATCSYAEYAQRVLDDETSEWVVNPMWANRPAGQIAKSTEALAWRKAFPADFSGLVLEDTAQPSEIDGDEVVTDSTPAPAPVEKAPSRKASGAARNAQRAARAQKAAADG